ncbi:TolC family protein [Nitratiruptor sp. SB155-2]|uniref:TolC family protein n=1 Tax=Nitratiruptor sp. (strain SB155-2) TaxID=387092 RepID=UPI0001586FF9|nr:TolC family protein [Nitratiruptor sp. SB155-2]BAF70825.1 hypothetical protein NIS_1719 [Nitratiruptor sp. SB155-2]
MKYLVTILIPMILSAQNFLEIVKLLDHNRLLQSKKYEVMAQKRVYEAAKGANYPKVDIALQGIYLKEQPTMSIHLGIPTLPSSFPAAAQNQYFGEISISYPLFSGFAITSQIASAKLQEQKSRLEQKDLERRLYLKTAQLYGAIYAAKHTEKALQKGLEAMELSLKKAKGFYEEGLIPLSYLSNIEAKKYQIESNLQMVRANMQGLFTQLSYLVDTSITSIGPLIDCRLPSQYDIEQRADIKALYKALDITKEKMRMAKSTFFPHIFVKAGLKGYGDDLRFNGDGYRNADQNYATIILQQNLFNGFSDTRNVEAAKYAKMATAAYLSDYILKVKSELDKDLFTYHALQSKIRWAQKRVEAAKNYYKLTKGRFENQLASADELSRAIADLAKARAELSQTQAQLFVQKCKILLQISLETFEKSMQL